MEGLVYLLCAATALTCTVLLFRGFWRSGSRLLLWCALFFLSLTVENATVFIDLVLVPRTDLYVLRSTLALLGVALLLIGLIWDVG